MRKKVKRFSQIAVSVYALCIAAAKADIQVNPLALTHYSHCVSEAKDRNKVYLLERTVLYRCGSDTAISYFNYLSRMNVGDQMISNAAGLFVTRPISSVGRCWHKIQDYWGFPVSIFGCDIYVEY
jgi:hypothetical protein